ncbi:MAG: glycosyltransferase family 4 protein [Ignavibacteriales bacterium]|nr:glycosyltransferase family 4 protein [Ignavibacteriales bacterium]
MTNRVLILTDDLKFTCGISSYLYNFLLENKSTEFDYYILCSGGDAVERFQEINAQIYVDNIFSEKRKSYLRFFIAIIKLFLFIRKYSPSIIHSQNYYAANIARFVSRLTKIKTVQTHHNFFKKTNKLKLLASEYQIVVNDDIKKYICLNYTNNGNRIQTIRYGIIEQNVSLPKRNNLLRVINAGRLIPEKGFDLYLDAIKQLPKNIFNQAEFYIAGEGSEKTRLVKRIEEEEINVTYLGILEPLIRFLKETDIFVFTSYWDAEGFPMSILEAGMCKNLIISSNFRGLFPFFINDFHGFIFKKQNTLELSGKIEKAVNNFNSLQVLINNFYLDIKKNFSLSISVEKTLSIYKSL